MTVVLLGDLLLGVYIDLGKTNLMSDNQIRCWLMHERESDSCAFLNDGSYEQRSAGINYYLIIQYLLK